MLNRGIDKQELLRIVDSVANEKSIDKELILNSMETAIQRAAYSKFGYENSIEATINREDGSIKIQKVLEIVESVEDPVKQISLKQAENIDKKNKNLKIGDKIYEELPQIDFGRIAAQSAKQVISSRVREAEKNRQYEDFIDKQGQILSGIIKRLEYGNIIVDLGKAEGVVKKDELIPREMCDSQGPNDLKIASSNFWRLMGSPMHQVDIQPSKPNVLCMLDHINRLVCIMDPTKRC